MDDVSVISETKSFSDKYCTQEMADADPIASKDKVILSNDAFANGEQLEKVYKGIQDLSFRLTRLV
jgi:hypothetical protein